MNNKLSHFVTYLPLYLAIICLLINTFVIGFVRTSGGSMLPTIPRGSLVLAKKITFSIERGDIVLAYADHTSLIKRVIGLPGETIHICQNGIILIDGEEYEDSFPDPWEDDSPYVGRDIVLADNEYFLIGDNRVVSRDSRSFGPVPRNRIFGQVVHIFAGDEARQKAEAEIEKTYYLTEEERG